MIELRSPMTGTLLEYMVIPGDEVVAGQEIAVLDSMKMLIPVLAEAAGRVMELGRPVNELVHEGEILLILE
jgi:acetyl-CoA carboxylase biotin carboxyl carrier protein